MQTLSFISRPINPAYLYNQTQTPVILRRSGMRGLGCAPGQISSCTGNGCSCSGGMKGLGANSLDSVINSAFSWLSGAVQTNLPTSAAVPPQYGSTGAIATELSGWLPYIIGGYLLYKVVSK